MWYYILMDQYLLLYEKIIEKHSKETNVKKQTFLCLLLETLHTIEFLLSDPIKKLSTEEKRQFLAQIATIYVREYKLHKGVITYIADNKDTTPYLNIFDDITSHIIEYCNQAGPQNVLPHVFDNVADEVENILNLL